LHAIAAALVVVYASGAAAVNATLDAGYPRIEAVLHHCPESAEAAVNGVPLGRVPFEAEPSAGECRVEVDAGGVSLFKLEPGDNLTIVFHSPHGDATIVVRLEAEPPGEGAGGELGEAPPTITGAPSWEPGEGDLGGLDSPGRGAWLAASLALAAAAAAVGVREYGGG